MLLNQCAWIYREYCRPHGRLYNRLCRHKGKCSMTTHHFQPTRYYRTIGTHEPALHIADGDTVITTTIDAFGYDQHGESVAERGNPMTGPFYVEGAEPDDTLAMHIDSITP